MQKNTNLELALACSSKRQNNIFIKNINNKYKLIPMNIKNNFIGENNYFPSDYKEWSNNVYYYNNNNIKNIPAYDLVINKLLKGYFNSYLNPSINFLYSNKRYTSLNKIFISKASIRHTNSKAIITIYVYDREKISLSKFFINYSHIVLAAIKELKVFVLENNNLELALNTHQDDNELLKLLNFFKSRKLRAWLNELRYKDILIYKLSKLISKFYRKKIKFNIIRLTSIAYNSDILVDVMKKSYKKTGHVRNSMKFILNQGLIEKIENTNDRVRATKNVDFNLLANKYQNLNINSIALACAQWAVKDVNINETIKNLYSTKNKNNEEIIFNSIKYKILGGIRIDIKGRLTRRFRADRSVYNTILKGSFRNIDSSYKGLTILGYRGCASSSIDYSMSISKRHVGAFAIKGWVSGR
uniref:Ribosomal protein 3 n=1 Tax=Hyalorhinocladiella minuta-bicolor TaxID=360146 RepID=C7SWF9_9PEZI|nr:ribosomal protein 3 [Hyalorhinocladiella minuta-bicolor]